MSTPRNIFGWSLKTICALLAWSVVMALLFRVNSRDARWLWGSLGTLVWALPLGILLAKAIPRRVHVLWIGPMSYPLAVILMGTVFFGATWISFPDVDLFAEAGSEIVSVALVLGAVPALAVAGVYLAVPRKGPEGNFCSKCGYDVRASIEQGRCPECGNQLVAGVDYAERAAGN